MRSLVRAGYLAAFLLLLTLPTRAQFLRYQVGQRLRAFERSYDQVPDHARRAAAADDIDSAVQAFFRLRLPEAAGAIDRAREEGLLARTPSQRRRLARALGLDLSRRFVDSTQPSLPAVAREVYSLDATDRDHGSLALELTLARVGKPDEHHPPHVLARFEFEADPPGHSHDLELTVGSLPPGDHHLLLTWIEGAERFPLEEPMLSIVEHLDERLANAGAAIEAWEGGPEPAGTDRESARLILGILRALAEGKTLESDVPAAALLDELEDTLRAIEHGHAHHGPAHPGSHRISLATSDGRSIPARVFVPEGLVPGREVPLVIAMHGAGGTENLFFEGYGHGKIVDLCRDRGWLLVAPRLGGFAAAPAAAVADAMASLYPVDPRRVVLVGHSMGAALAVASLGKTPDRFAALAALGGGGRVVPSDDLKRVPVFVGVGSGDFALRGARSLADALRAAALERVRFHEYPGVEHLLVVQVALPDVFQYFDACLKP